MCVCVSPALPIIKIVDENEILYTIHNCQNKITMYIIIYIYITRYDASLIVASIKKKTCLENVIISINSCTKDSVK